MGITRTLRSLSGYLNLTVEDGFCPGGVSLTELKCAVGEGKSRIK
jgi:hypothetical protein